MSLHKKFTQNVLNQLMKKRIDCCVRVRDFEPKILIKGVHLTNFKKNCSICYRTSFYSIFDMSSCIKPEIQKDLPKITKIK